MSNLCFGRLMRAGAAALALWGSSAPLAASEETIHVQAFDMPRYSGYLSARTIEGMKRRRALFDRARRICDPSTKLTGGEIRACEALMYPPIMEEARKIYSVRIEESVMGGVQTDIVTPAGGLPQRNARRVLINVHGGGFKYGARFGGQLDSMPLAALAQYQVVTVDYRMAPEHRFPAASEDVAAVYRELLKTYHASSIGLYGCSAGGRIVGQTVAWMLEHHLPVPGAVAILCSAPTGFGGDSNYMATAVMGMKPMRRGFDSGYYEGVKAGDPVAFAGESDQMLRHFPPTLLMTSGRDYSLSPVLQMHSRLVHLGTPTELHIFEGLGHGEFLNFYIPEAERAAAIIGSFFDERLR